MKLWRVGLLGVATVLAAGMPLPADQVRERRSGYSYVRLTSGEVTVVSGYNGRVQARRNLPITAGDEIVTEGGARAEIALADGNLFHVGGGTRARFVALRDEQGGDDDFSAIEVNDGSVVLTAVGADEDALPRIDTDDATVYLSAGARVRVNADPRRGTVVIVRAGKVEVRTRQDEYSLRAGQYLMVRADEEPEIARGTFSRDRFDIWAADRVEALYETRSASARYVDDEYDSEVVALDGYGDWEYSSTYSTNVWVPRVSVGWTPYSYGSWYYTRAGLSWWSYDPWGWFPHHYGSWYYDSFRTRWCWAPSYVYSPAWVYWGYSPGYLGWCPIGYYSFYSPWWDTYYRRWGIHGRGGISISLHGTFPSRRVDFRGWNFTDANTFNAGVGRMDVVPGSRLVNRLGPEVAISSRPIVVNARGGSAREAVRDFVREAPRTIARGSSPDSGRLAPILSREPTLPTQTVEALRERTVVVERGRLTGPGAADLAPRGAVVERGRTLDDIAREPRERAPRETDGKDSLQDVLRRPRAIEPSREAVGQPDEGWRGRGRVVERAPRSAEPEGETPERESLDRGRRAEQPETREAEPRARSRSEPRESDWRGRSRSPRAAEPSEARPAPETDSGKDWRSRSEVPPARRVIEGAVPGRRAVERREAEPSDSGRSDRPAPRARESSPRSYEPREPRSYDAPRRESAPAPRERREAPRSIERSAPAPAPPPAPRAESHRSAPSSQAPRGRHQD